MSPLYCLLHSGDDNFKAQVLFMGGGGGEDGGCLGRARALGLGFSPVCGEACGVFGASPYIRPLQEQQREVGDSHKLLSDSHPEVTWPHPTPSLSPQSQPTFQGLGPGPQKSQLW